MQFRSLLIPALTLCVCGTVPGSVAAQQSVGFAGKPRFDLQVPTFSDRDVSQLVETLDDLLRVKKDPAAWTRDAAYTLWSFGRQLQAAQLTPIQEDRVLEHLANLERAWRLFMNELKTPLEQLAPDSRQLAGE